VLYIHTFGSYLAERVCRRGEAVLLTGRSEGIAKRTPPVPSGITSNYLRHGVSLRPGQAQEDHDTIRRRRNKLEDARLGCPHTAYFGRF
jgi:hypothetical protein